MLKIALVSPYTYPFYCGNSVLAERLREGLSGRGNKVSLFDSHRDTPDQAIAFSPQILHSLHADRPHHWVKAFMTKRSVPWVITLTGTDYTSWCGKKDPPVHIKENLERAGALVVFHGEALESLKQCLPSVQGKMEVIPQGVAPSGKNRDSRRLREEKEIGAQEIVFLMVSSIRPVKNVGAGIGALFEVEKQVPNVKLVLIGPIQDHEEARRVLDLGSRLKCFRYLGETSPFEVREWMAAADVFLNTSLSEGMPGAVLEAMAEGLPILASSVTGNCSLVFDNENGLLFSVENREDLIRAAIRLSRDRGLRKQLGKAGQERVAAHHPIERELDRYQSLYHRLLARER